jgi:hypothetical protein
MNDPADVRSDGGSRGYAERALNAKELVEP